MLFSYPNFTKPIINTKSWSDSNEQAINAYNTLGGLYLEYDDIVSAAIYKEMSLAVAVELLTEESPRTWNQMLNNLEFYINTNNEAKAAEYLTKLTTVVELNETVSPTIKGRFEHLKQQHAGLTENSTSE